MPYINNMAINFSPKLKVHLTDGGVVIGLAAAQLKYVLSATLDQTVLSSIQLSKKSLNCF